jgi:hypothetical protein
MNTAAQDAADLERLIDAAYRRMCKSIREDDKQAACDEMVRLVKQRSPEQIRKMERERRLNR